MTCKEQVTIIFVVNVLVILRQNWLVADVNVCSTMDIGYEVVAKALAGSCKVSNRESDGEPQVKGPAAVSAKMEGVRRSPPSEAPPKQRQHEHYYVTTAEPTAKGRCQVR